MLKKTKKKNTTRRNIQNQEKTAKRRKQMALVAWMKGRDQIWGKGAVSEQNPWCE